MKKAFNNLAFTMLGKSGSLYVVAMINNISTIVFLNLVNLGIFIRSTTRSNLTYYVVLSYNTRSSLLTWLTHAKTDISSHYIL